MSSRQNSRHIEIRLILQKRPGISFEELVDVLEAKDYKVSKRTLERDIAGIRYDYGEEVIYNRRKKGYFIEGGNKETIQMLHRIKENLNTTALIELSQQKEYKELIEFEKVMEAPDPSFFRIIAQAIKQKRLIQIQYIRYGRTECKTHIVQPRLLKEYQDRWYIVTTQEGRTDPVVFSLDTNRLLEVSILGEKFKPAEKLEVIKKRFEDVIGISVHEYADAEEIIVAIHSDYAGYIESQPWHHSQELLKEEDNEKYYSFWLSRNVELEKRVLSFMPHIRIVKPESLKGEILQILQESLNNNL